MRSYQAPTEWEEWASYLAAGLHGRSRWRLTILMVGMLFAAGRRVVTSWLRAGGISGDYQDYYFFLQSVGHRFEWLGRRLLWLVGEHVLRAQGRILLAVDDTPTKRYGPKVEAAGVHHDPSPRPHGGSFCYGHVWVTLAAVVRHPVWGTIALPIFSWLYARQKDVARLPGAYGWSFRTKLELAADLVAQAVAVLKRRGKQVWVVTDGAYVKRRFVRSVTPLGVTLVGRLRKDSALRDLPAPETRVRRGRKRTYGKNRISLAKRAAHRLGWQAVTCRLYGVEALKVVKTFLATHRIFKGVIRVVIVQESRGPQFLYCTDAAASVGEILEAYADRAAIEQAFHDVKEVWGAGQQQVRNLWSNIGVWHLNLWMSTLVELWAWTKKTSHLVRRDDSPWDDPDRRPSHADRRKCLQAAFLREELMHALPTQAMRTIIRPLLKRLLRIAI